MIKNPPANAGDIETQKHPWQRSPGGGRHGKPTPVFLLLRTPWTESLAATVHRAQHQTWLKDLALHRVLGRATLPEILTLGCMLHSDSSGQRGNYRGESPWGIFREGEIWETLVKLTNVLVSRLMKENQDYQWFNFEEKKVKKTPNSVQLAEKLTGWRRGQCGLVPGPWTMSAEAREGLVKTQVGPTPSVSDAVDQVGPGNLYLTVLQMLTQLLWKSVWEPLVKVSVTRNSTACYLADFQLSSQVFTGSALFI